MRCILHPQLKNRSPLSKESELLRSLDIQSLLDMASIQFYPPKSDILSTKCKELGLSPSQGIYSQRGMRCILHPQLKNRSPLCKVSELLRLLDILSLLGKQGIMSNLFCSNILLAKCKALELGSSQGICFLLDSLSTLPLQLMNMSRLCKLSEFLRPLDIQSQLGMGRK
jgi:hypothetical protein